MFKRDSKDLKRSAFTLKNIALNGLLITFLFCINKLGALGNIICLSCLAVMAVRSVSGALKAMAILGLVVMGNPFIVEKTFVLTLFRFPVFGLAGGRILFEMLNYRPDILRAWHLNSLLLFGSVCVILAPINGYFTQISILKAVMFTFGAYSILVGTELNRSKTSDLTVFFTSLAIFIVVGSYVTFPLGISHLIGLAKFGVAHAQAGLAGITAQQQALGAFLSMLAIFCFSMAVFSKLPRRWIFVVVFLAILPLMLKTLSRTSVGTMVGAILMVICLAPFFLRGQKAMFNRFKPLPWLVGGTALSIGLILFDLMTGGNLAKAAMDFALKGAGNQFITVEAGDFAASRTALVERSWMLFLEHPLTGINFGTSYDPSFSQNATLLTAPTEKGFIPTAVLEEVGLIGAGFFLLFLCSMFVKLYRDENILGIAVFGGFLIQNLGEMMFFSFGGAGLFSWSIVGAGIAVGYRHQFIRRRN